MRSELSAVLCCPVCHGALLTEGEILRCGGCFNSFAMVEGMPDLRVYESPAHANSFNREQAIYESALHDNVAESVYERAIVRRYGTKTRQMVEKWSSAISEGSHEGVLDYGCGTGQVSRVLSRSIDPVFAFDISERSVRKNTSDNGVCGIAANAFFLPFRDDAFDVICVNGVFHHIVDLDAAMEELSRVCRGDVYISDGRTTERSSFANVWSYPGAIRKAVYAFYALLYLPYKLWAKAKRRFARASNRGVGGSSPTHNSVYERPLEAAVVERLLEARGFKRKELRYYTNIFLPGDGIIKRKATRILVNGSVGTHFDLRMRKIGR